MKPSILLFISIITVQPTSKAMETQPVSLEQKLRQFNRKATFLYEQLFSFELLSATILTRREDNFHADVLFARDQIRETAQQTLLYNPLPFDIDAPPHEKYKYTHLYHTLQYLLEQKHYRQFTIDYESSKHENSLYFIDSISPQLNQFAPLTERDRLLLLYQCTEYIQKLLYLYRSKSDSLDLF
jgi:hypothetical protein